MHHRWCPTSRTGRPRIPALPSDVERSERRPLVDAWPAYVVSFAVYVGAGLAFKSTVLNWIIGPLWLLLSLWLVPNAVRLVFRRGAS